MTTKVLFLGYGLDKDRKEAVSVNTVRTIKLLNEIGIQSEILSIGYSGKEFGSSFVDAIIRRKSIIYNIFNFIKTNNVTHVVDVFVLPISSQLFTIPLMSFSQDIKYIKEIHNDAGWSRHITLESFIRLLGNTNVQFNNILRKFPSSFTRNPGLSNKYKIRYLPSVQEISNDSRRSSIKLRVAYLGHPLKKKGIYNFPPLFELLSENEKQELTFNFSLSSIGQREEVAKLLKNSAHKNGVDLKIIGEVEPIRFFREQDIYILPILDIYGAVSTPNTILEAMEAGCTVVATKIESLKGICIDGKNSLLMPSPTPLEMLRAIRALKETKKRRGLANQARKDIMNKFNRQQSLNILKEIYGTEN